MLPTRMGQVDTSPSPRVTGPPFTHPQHSETGVEPGLAELPPLGFRQNDQDVDQLQADRSNLLFGQPLSASAPLTTTSKSKEQQNTFPGNNMLPGSFCQPATADIASGVVGSGGLDDNGLYQRNSAAAWPSMQAAQPLRTFTKVKTSSSNPIPADESFRHRDLACNLHAFVRGQERWLIINLR